MSDLLPLLRSQQWEIRLVCPIASPISERCKSSPKSDFFWRIFYERFVAANGLFTSGQYVKYSPSLQTPPSVANTLLRVILGVVLRNIR